MADKKVDEKNKMILKDAFSKRDFSKIDISNLIRITENQKGEILKVDFDIFECEKLMMQIVYSMTNETSNLTERGYILYMPLGYITNIPMLANFGSNIPVYIVLSDIVLGNVRTEVRTIGINNSLLELYIDFDFSVNSVLPFNDSTVTTHFSALVASTLISGMVPNFYGSTLTNETSTFSLPIDANLWYNVERIGE